MVLGSTLLGVPEGLLTMPLLVLFVSCFALGRYVTSWWGASGVGAIDLGVHWAAGLGAPGLDDLLWVGALTFGPYVLGRFVLTHARTNVILAEHARRLVEEQRQVAERAVADERRRIARELHDVIAHSLSVMVVQAGAAREVLDLDPAAADLALAEIQRAGRASLAETGRLLGLLREESDSDLAPQPVASDLPALVEAFRGAGLDVRLTMDGPTDALPAALGLSVFRIVEEGLTNALKHAPGGSVEVRYLRRPHYVVVDLASTSGLGPAVPVSSNGHGLVGMRERAAVFGGALTAAPTEGGGFLVSARLPVAEGT
jgi:signal transduction histidine kinase